MILEIKESWMKNRSLFKTVITSIFYPGLGHIYNGYLKRGIIIIFFLPFFFILCVSSFWGNYYAFIISSVIFLLFDFAIIFDSIRLANKNNKLNRYMLKSYNKWYYYALVIVIIICSYQLLDIYYQNSRYSNSRIVAASMKPNLMINDRVMIDRYYYEKNEMKRFDIITFYVPDEPEIYVLKRVVGLEGDLIEIRDFDLYINGKLYDEIDIIKFDEEHFLIKRSIEKIEKNPDSEIYKRQYDDLIDKFNVDKNFGPYIVEKDSVFVLGDNRFNSLDSRDYGTINISEIKGKILYKFWPEYSLYKY
jgi:signal peptidase I